MFEYIDRYIESLPETSRIRQIIEGIMVVAAVAFIFIAHGWSIFLDVLVALPTTVFIVAGIIIGTTCQRFFGPFPAICIMIIYLAACGALAYWHQPKHLRLSL